MDNVIYNEGQVVGDQLGQQVGQNDEWIFMAALSFNLDCKIEWNAIINQLGEILSLTQLATSMPNELVIFRLFLLTWQLSLRNNNRSWSSIPSAASSATRSEDLLGPKAQVQFLEFLIWDDEGGVDGFYVGGVDGCYGHGCKSEGIWGMAKWPTMPKFGWFLSNSD